MLLNATGSGKNKFEKDEIIWQSDREIAPGKRLDLSQTIR
jgi:hypothetical protein